MEQTRQNARKKLALQRLEDAYNYLQVKKVSDELKKSINDKTEILDFEINL